MDLLNMTNTQHDMTFQIGPKSMIYKKVKFLFLLSHSFEIC